MYPRCGSQYPGVNAELGEHCGEAEQEKVRPSEQNPQNWNTPRIQRLKEPQQSMGSGVCGKSVHTVLREIIMLFWENRCWWGRPGRCGWFLLWTRWADAWGPFWMLMMLMNVRWTGGLSGWWRQLPSWKPNFQRGLTITNAAAIIIYSDEYIINDYHEYYPVGHYCSHPQGHLDHPDKERDQVRQDAGDVSWSCRCRCTGDLLRDCLSGVQVTEFPFCCFLSVHSGGFCTEPKAWSQL